MPRWAGDTPKAPEAGEGTGTRIARVSASDVLARIRELPENVKNQIAAGEVVERPASVVKELVENALDAGATAIEVDLEEGGVKLVRVRDDGIGMHPDDLDLAFSAHATSKLSTVDDLDHIASLGFRGEALASIGSIARVRIVSRPRDARTGACVENEGGRIRRVGEVGAPRGTTVEVRDLFYNTPARRRFLKRTSTELGRALDVVQRLALAHEGVGFVVNHDGARVHDVEASMDLRGRVRRTFGAELAETLVAVRGEDGPLAVEGYVAPPRFARRDTTRQMWFLNGRPLRDKLLVRCLKEAYRGFIDDGRQPVAFVLVRLPPEAVDVNVHPTKSEVRFRDERRVFGFLLTRLRAAVAATDMATPGARLIESVERREGRAPFAPRLPDPGALAPAQQPAPPERVAAPSPDYELRPAPRAETRAGAPEGRGADPWAPRDELRGPFLRIASTYLVRALPDGFEIVDQHALHERLTFEGLRAQVRSGGVEVQRRLVPELVELSRAEVARLEEHQGALAAIGIELDAFGATTIAVRGVPALLGDVSPERLVGDVLRALESTGKVPDADELLEDVLHSAACRSSVMAGDALTDDEIRALLARAARLPSDQTCPHGRPTRVRFTLADLERAFHRR